MSEKKVYTAIGLMSGTSLDGIDAAIIQTDGYFYIEKKEFITVPYSQELRDSIRACFGKIDRNKEDVLTTELEVTLAHIDVVADIAKHYEIDVIGMHGQTITHDPAEGLSIQLGDGGYMAREVGCDVVYDFRKADIRAGGQGAPLMPVYHRAMVAGVQKPCAVLNIGGVSNITYVDEADILAFDCGPGNALMDDFVLEHLGKPYDEGGALAASGQADMELVSSWMEDEYFKRQPPKSLDRNKWHQAVMGERLEIVTKMSPENAMATLMEFTAQAIIEGMSFMPKKPVDVFVAGGGVHNSALMERLGRDMSVKPVNDLGFDSDSIEAEGFAYLAVRHLLDLPGTFPATTGVSKPTICGTLEEHDLYDKLAEE